MSTKYRVFCQTENIWVTTTGTPQAVCPNDAGHTVFDNNVQDLSKYNLSLSGLSKQVVAIPQIYRNNTSSYGYVGRFVYFGDSDVTIHSIKVLGYKTRPNINSYNLRVYDVSNNTVVAELTDLINDTPELMDMGEISNIPTAETIMELQLKQLGGGNAEVEINQVIIYTVNNKV